MTYTLQVALASRAIDDETYVARIQKLQRAAPVIHFGWTPISNLMIAPRSVIVVEKFVPYIWVSFDYIQAWSPFAVVRVSEKDGERITTHFREFISYN